MKRLLSIFLLFAVMSLANCGKKAPPRLYDPGKVTKMLVKTANSSMGTVRFSWEPVIDADKIVRYDIFGSTEDEKFHFITSVNAVAKEGESEYSFSQSSGLKEGNWYHYVIAARGKDESILRISDTIDIFFSIEPSPPLNVTATLKDDFVRISWTSPTTKADGTPFEEVTGYNIYRKKEGQDFFRPINATLITKNNFIDMSLKKDNIYYYIVRAVDNYFPPWHESVSSEVVSVDYADTIPSEPPTELKSIGGAGRISLSWQKSISDDVAGYKVYRSAEENGEYELLTEEVLKNEYYEDMDIEKETYYFYKVKSVDNSKNKNESAFSNIASGRAF